MAVRHAGAAAFAARRPTIPARHLGGQASLVDEHQSLGVEIELAIEPGLAPPHKVRPVLLARVGRLFLRVIRCRAKNRHSVAMLVLTP